MITGKSFLRQIDEAIFESKLGVFVDSLNGNFEQEAILEAVDSLDIDEYKKMAFLEYLDKNKDKLLSMSKYTEGDPVQMADDYAPHQHKRGVVMSRGAVYGTYRVKFEDGEYDVPEHHMTRADAIANEQAETVPKPTQTPVVEYKCLAVLADGTIKKVIVESFENVENSVSELLVQEVLVVFPEQVSKSFVEPMAEMTDDQKAKREEIVVAMKKNKDSLQKRYGDRWENVMYAVATKKAMGESLDEATKDIIFKQRGSDGSTIKIVKNGEYFNLEVVGTDGKLSDSHEYSDIKEAEKAARNLL